MKRRLITGGRILWPVLLSMAVMAGCGGDAEVTIVEHGETVRGAVFLPAGSARLESSLLQRFASLIVSSAQAISGSTAPASGVTVTATAVRDSDLEEGEVGAEVIGSDVTDSAGRYSIDIGSRSVSDCASGRVLVHVDRDGLTRALALPGGQDTDVDFVSETAVRLLFDAVREGTGSLCDISNQEVLDLSEAIRAASGTAIGDTAAALNESALALAVKDPGVIDTVEGIFAAAPTATVTLKPTATSTATATKEAATATATVPGAATATATVAGPTNTATVAVPTATATVPVVVATDTPTVAVATATATVAVATVTATVAVPTNTATVAVPTTTATIPPDAPKVNIGSASGNPGDTVTIAVTLENSGDIIVATSNDITYDSTQVDVAIKPNLKPDCTVDESIGLDSLIGKSLSIKLFDPVGNSRTLRVGVLATDNVNVIPDGPLFTCNFKIAAGATPGAKVLANKPGASDAASQPVTVGGSDGTITVGGGQEPTHTATVAVPTATATVAAPTHTATVPVVVPSNTATVAVPTATATVPAATATATVAVPTHTATVAAATATATVPAGGAAVNIGDAAGNPGDTVTIAVTLADSGGVIVATSNDITYDSTQVDVAIKPNLKPDCTVDESIGLDSLIGKSLSIKLFDPVGNSRTLRVGVLATDNVNVIPDGPLYTCKFKIAAGATAGAKVLTNLPGASDAASQPVTVGGTNGTITVGGAQEPTHTATVAVPTHTATVAVPTHTATVAVPTATATVAVPTNTATVAAATATATVPAGGAAVNIGDAAGNPGDTVTVAVTLADSGGIIVATSNDITYDPTQVDVAIKPNLKPDCTVDESIGLDSLVGKSLSIKLFDAVGNSRTLRVGVLATDNVNVIPDGPVYTCKFKIAAGATGGAKVLANLPGASDAASQPVTVGGTDGTITVAGGAGPTATLTVAVPTATATVPVPTATATVAAGGAAVNIGSASGSQGATVTVAVTLADSGGIIVATSNDITYDPTQVDVAIKPNLKPDCTVDESINLDTLVGKSLSIKLFDAVGDSRTLRVGVLATDNVNVIPDGPLYTCKFKIAAGASAGAKVLTNLPGASDAASQPVTVGGSNGTITVQ